MLLSRDNSRTPMQWNDSSQAGFTAGEPWIKVNPNYKKINVEAALKDQGSVYYFYKKLIELRKQNEVMVYGDYRDLLPDDEHIYVYTRSYNGVTWLIVLNHGDEKQTFNFDGFTSRELILSNYKSDREKMKKYCFRMKREFMR